MANYRHGLKLYIGNSFSLSMLDRKAQLGNPCRPRTGPESYGVRIPKPVDDVRAFIGGISMGQYMIESILGHASSQALFEKELGFSVPVNRKSIKLGPRDRLLVGQYTGPRLEEGATELPEGAKLEWWIV